MNKISDLKDIATCNYCNCIFESPVILPCSETICQKHVEEMKLKHDSIEEIKCHHCIQLHNIPKDGFPKDKRTAKLIELELHQIETSGIQQEAMGLYRELNNKIDYLESLRKDPENFIEEYFGKLINQIDLEREENKQLIDKWHHNCFQETQRLKTKCLEDLNNDNDKPLIEGNTHALIDGIRKDFQLFQDQLLIPELSVKSLPSKIIDRSKSCIQILKKIIEDYKEQLLDNKEFKFEVKRSILAEDLGQVNVRKKVFIKLIFFYFSLINLTVKPHQTVYPDQLANMIWGNLIN